LLEEIELTLAGLPRDAGRIVSIENRCISRQSGDGIAFAVSANHMLGKIWVEDGHPTEEDRSELKTIVRVPSVTLLQLLDEHGLSEVDLLKMDIEGAEFQVLEDPEGLRRCRYLIVEVHGLETRRNDFARRLEQMGFELSRSHGVCYPVELLFARRKG
jgi:FkbM family methyltransferase